MSKAKKVSKNNVALRGGDKNKKRYIGDKAVEPVQCMMADGRKFIAAQYIDGGQLVMADGVPVAFSESTEEAAV